MLCMLFSLVAMLFDEIILSSIIEGNFDFSISGDFFGNSTSGSFTSSWNEGVGFVEVCLLTIELGLVTSLSFIFGFVFVTL